MKTVVNTSMVAHLWAHQSQPNARNAGNSCSFDGPVFYSYRTPIAMLHDSKHAGRIALISSNGYSMTTKNKHMSPMRHALRDVVRSFTVPYVGAYGGMAPRDPFEYRSIDGQGKNNGRNEWHARNVAHLVSEYRDLGARIRRAQWTYYTSPEQLLNTLQDAATIVRDYCEAFGLEVPELDVADDTRVIWRAREIREERRNDPKEIAKRERNREQAEARKAAKAEREQRERFEREAEQRTRFRNGQNGYYRVSDEHGGALLRVDADMVRTSYGAECPLDDARRAFPLIARARERGEAWRPNGLQGIALGSFAINEIRADGSIRAGCHVIHWPEIESAARALGLTS